MTDAFAVRGVIEGFYGRPWTQAQRLDLVDFLAARQLNTFVYAPKDDPLLRRDWQTPFGGDEHRVLTELRDRCRTAGLRLIVCVSPGLTIRYSDPGHVALLADKLRSALDLGADGVGLLLDDIPDRLQHPADLTAFTGIAEAHAALVTQVAARLREDRPHASLMVCPLVYCGYGDEPYLVELAAGIPRDVDLLWTGRAICSATLDLADAEVFTAATGRPPLYWDNYPVNDVAMTYQAHLGPYRGRDPRLATASRGIIANPMELAESSKIPLATIADFLADPVGYDPERSWRRAIADVVGGGGDDHAKADVAAFTAYADNVRFSCLEPSDAPIVSRLLEDLAFAVAVGGPAEVGRAAGAVASAGHTLLDAVARITGPGFANPALAAEQAPWLRVAAIGARALVRLGEVLADPTTDRPKRAETLTPHLSELTSQRFRVFGDVLEMTLHDLIHDFGNQPGDTDRHPREGMK